MSTRSSFLLRNHPFLSHWCVSHTHSRHCEWWVPAWNPLFLTQINTCVIPQESWEGDDILWIIVSFRGGMLSFIPRAVGLYCDLDFSKGHIVLRMCLPGYLQIERSQILNQKKNDNDNIRGKTSQIPARYSLEGRAGYTARYLFFFRNVSTSLTF